MSLRGYQRGARMTVLKKEQSSRPVCRWGLRSLRENSALEGHGFSRAVNDTPMPGFSH